MPNKIAPFLWFDKQAGEAIDFYTAIFPNSRIHFIRRYPADYQVGPQADMAGRVLTAAFELAGMQFFALDGGPQFQINPSISFYVQCASAEEIGTLWEQLAAGGSVLMPLQEYPFSARFGWVRDRFGITWQLSLDGAPLQIVPFLTFTQSQHGKAEEAIRFYASLFADSGVDALLRYEAGEEGDEGTLRFARFRLGGQPFMAIDGGTSHDFTFNEAISLYVDCIDQAEQDALWNSLSAVPEAEQCGWLKDRYGVSWQIVPSALGPLMSDPDPARSRRVTEALMQMKKIDIPALERARDGA